MSQQRSEETRARILSAAYEAFSREGYDATGVAQICAAAGVSKGAFYHHFPTKQAVFLTLLEDWLAEIDRGLAGALEGSPSVAQAILGMAGQVRETFRTADRRLPMFLEFWSKASRDPAIRPIVIAPYRRYEAYFAALIRQGVEDGSLNPVDPDLAARALVSLAVGLFLQGILDPQGAAWDLVALGSIQLMMSGLAR
jgi:AcrR family transcriptional regulator